MINTRAKYARARKSAKTKYEKECNAMAKEYFKANVILKKGVVFESSRKPPKGATNRFVVFIIQVKHFLEVEMFDVAAGVWWLDKENKCVKWETLWGVDNHNHKFVRSKNQKYIKPVE